MSLLFSDTTPHCAQKQQRDKIKTHPGKHALHLKYSHPFRIPMFEQIRPYIPLLIPLIILQLVLMIAALLDLARRERTRGPKWVWALVILFVNIIGPIIYFVAGRQDE